MFEGVRASLARAISPNTALVNPYTVISEHQPDTPIYTEMTVRKATREGYKISVYVYRAVRTIVQAASAIPWIILDKNSEPMENHELGEVLKNPCPEFSGQDLMEIKIAHLLLVGNALWMPIIIRGKIREIWPVMPDLVAPIPSNVRGEWLKGWQVYGIEEQPIVPPSTFIHFMQMDPGNLYWGTSPLIAAARTIDTDNEAQDTQKVSMQNRATPDGVFTHESVLTAEQFEEAQRQVHEKFMLKSKRREPWVLGAGAKWNQMSMTPVEMDYVLSRLHGLRDIAGAFGISPIFLGDLEQSSYNNMMEARKALYEDVVIPLLDDTKSTLNLRIKSMYPEIGMISYDVSKVAALRGDFNKKVESAKNLFGMGVPFEEINAKLELGFEEFEGWDVGYLPFNLTPSGTQPVQESEEDIEKNEPWFKELRERVASMTKALNLDTEEKKIIHWKRIDDRRIGWSKVIAKKVEPLYIAEGKKVVKAYIGSGSAGVEAAIKGSKKDWTDLIKSVSYALIEDFGNEIAEDLDGEPSKGEFPTELRWIFDPFSAAVNAWIAKHAAESVTSILKTSIIDVHRIIQKGVADGIGTQKIAKSLRKFYDEKSAWKAMRVARTETSMAAGYGQREAALQSGVVKTHSWISSRDDRVRDSHIRADDGQAIPLSQRFKNGLLYPGDSAGGPGEIVYCRCVESFGTK